MERGFARIIMAVVFSVLIAISFTACGKDSENHLVRSHNGSGGSEDEYGSGGGDDGGGEDPALVVITRVSVDSDGN